MHEQGKTKRWKTQQLVRICTKGCQRLLESHKQLWNKFISVTTDGTPNLTHKNLGLLKMIQDFLRNWKYFFPPLQTGFNTNHVTSIDVKLVNSYSKRFEPQTVHIPVTRSGCWRYRCTIPLQCSMAQLR